MKVLLAVYTLAVVVLAPVAALAAPARTPASSASELSAADQAFLSARDAVRVGDRERLEPWARHFYDRSARAFFNCYLRESHQPGLLPDDRQQLRVLLEMQLVEKALYELLYELDNRPTWAELPLRGLLDLSRS